MNIQFTGKIIDAEPVQQGVSQRDGSQWVSQNFVIEELNTQYPSHCVFKVYGSDKIQQFRIVIGEVLTVHLGIKANKSKNNGRWFNSLDCWKVERFGQQAAPTAPNQQQPYYQQQMQTAPTTNQQQSLYGAAPNQDNLPF